MPPNNARCFLLDCDEALPGIVAHLDGKGLAALGSTCKHLRELVDGHDGKRWWKRLCWTLLGKTVCAVHLEAAGGASVADTAQFWRRLYRLALRADTFHWHAESSRRAWGSVHAHDESSRIAAFDAAAAADPNASGPYVGRVQGKDFQHHALAMAITDGAYRPAGDPEISACLRDVRRRAQLAVAPQMSPDLMRSGHTSTLIDDMGLVVVVGGLMKSAMTGRRLVSWLDDDGGDGGEDLMGGREGDIKVTTVKLPEAQVIAPEVLNWKAKERGKIEEEDTGGYFASLPPAERMAGENATLLPNPPSRFRHTAVEARLPIGSRLALEAFGDDGEGWGNGFVSSSSSSSSPSSSSVDNDNKAYYNSDNSNGDVNHEDGWCITDCKFGTTLLVFGGYDGARSVFGGRELLLLRVSRDGRRVRWGKCTAGGDDADVPPPCFHHTMTRLRRDVPTPRAVLIGGQTNNMIHGANKLGGGAVYELDLRDATWTRHGTDGWPQPAAGMMTSRWLHMAALRPEQAPDELHDDDKYVDVFTTQDRETGKTLVHSVTDAATRTAAAAGRGRGGGTGRGEGKGEGEGRAGGRTEGSGSGSGSSTTYRSPSIIAPPWYTRERRGEEIVILGGFDDSPHRMVAEMEPWVLCVDTWRWKLAPKPPHSDSSHPLARARCRAPVGRHRTSGCVVGGRLMVVHGGCPAQGASWLSDTAVLDLTTLTWRHVDVHVEGLENVRHKRIAGHTMDAMMCFGGCKRGSFGITPISKIEFLMFGPPPSGVVAEQQERTFREESMAAKRVVSRYVHLCVDQVRGRHMRILHHETRGVCAVPLEGQYFQGDDDDEDTEDDDTDEEEEEEEEDTEEEDDNDDDDDDDDDTSDEDDDDVSDDEEEERDEESASSDDSDEEERSDSDSDSNSDSSSGREGSESAGFLEGRLDRLRTVLDEGDTLDEEEASDDSDDSDDDTSDEEEDEAEEEPHHAEGRRRDRIRFVPAAAADDADDDSGSSSSDEESDQEPQ